jgi:PKD domain
VRRHRGLIGLLLLFAAACGAQLTTGGGAARAEGCLGGFVRGSIEGEGNRVKLSLGARSATCNGSTVEARSAAPQAFFTHQIACSPSRQQAAAGLCSATPCPNFGQFFAFRTINFPNGTSAPAGFRCVTLNQATASPGITMAQVFDAVRRVKLPGGEIGAVPAMRGLANLQSFFFVRGATQPPVDLQVSGSTVHAVFRVVEYRWDFGDGQVLVTTGPGTRGLSSEVRAAFRRRGNYRVAVTVAWVAEAFLQGRRVGQVDGLASTSQTTYPVAEVRAVLTG